MRKNVNCHYSDSVRERHELAALDDPANPNRFSYTHTSHSVYKDLINFLKFSDQNFSLAIVLSLFLIFWQISSWVFL